MNSRAGGKPQVSVIMPAFNTAAFIGASVESVRMQGGVSWELLLVDDGSTDGTMDIARRYAAADGRIRVLRNRGNRGPGGSRNTGLKAARGETVFFLDSDDFLLPGALHALFTRLGETGSPVVRGLGKQFCMQRWLTYSPPATETDSVRPDRASIPLVTFCLHLYDAAFLAENGVMFPEDMLVGEDTVFLCRVYCLLESMPVSQRAVHLYRINHKPTNPSAEKSVAFARRALRVRAIFEEYGKSGFTVPYYEKLFFPEWLRRLHAARAEGPENAAAYLRLCAEALTGLEKDIQPVLAAQLGPLAESFLAACAGRDTEAMLAALERSGQIRPESVFIGIDRPFGGFSWQAYRLLRRLLSLAAQPDTLKTLVYLARLRRRGAAAARGSERG